MSVVSQVGPYDFKGSDYDPALDFERLHGQCKRVHDALKDGRWRTLSEIHSITGDPPASISGQIRHLRTERFGAHLVETRRREGCSGLWEYKLHPAGTGNPKQHPLLVRAEVAEEHARALASALEQVWADAPALLDYLDCYGEPS